MIEGQKFQDGKFFITPPKTQKEWETFFLIRKKELCDPYFRAIGDVNLDTFLIESPRHHYFCFFKDDTIIGVACVEFLKESYAAHNVTYTHCAALRNTAIERCHQNKGYGTKFVKLIEEWVRYRGAELFLLHAAPLAYTFYKRLGYVEMPFNEEHNVHYEILVSYTDMGKVLIPIFPGSE
jgi:GNAT superfamily N-acetyltransferase